MGTTKNVTLWGNRFADRKASGLKVNDWCDKNHISRHAYYYWHRKIQGVRQKAYGTVFAEISNTMSAQKNPGQEQEIVITWK